MMPSWDEGENAIVKIKKEFAKSPETFFDPIGLQIYFHKVFKNNAEFLRADISFMKVMELLFEKEKQMLLHKQEAANYLHAA